METVHYGNAERWADVAGYEGLYEISDRGRCRGPRGSRRQPGDRLLTGKPSKESGYVLFELWRNGKRSVKRAHRLVAKAFIGDIPEGMEVNHIDSNRANNLLGNLEILTPSGNQQHAHDVGHGKNGEDVANAVLTEDVVRGMRAAYRRGVVGYQSVAKEFGVNVNTARSAIIGKSWSRVGIVRSKSDGMRQMVEMESR